MRSRAWRERTEHRLRLTRSQSMAFGAATSCFTIVSLHASFPPFSHLIPARRRVPTFPGPQAGQSFAPRSGDTHLIVPWDTIPCTPATTSCMHPAASATITPAHQQRASTSAQPHLRARRESPARQFPSNRQPIAVPTTPSNAPLRQHLAIINRACPPAPAPTHPSSSAAAQPASAPRHSPHTSPPSSPHKASSAPTPCAKPSGTSPPGTVTSTRPSACAHPHLALDPKRLPRPRQRPHPLHPARRREAHRRHVGPRSAHDRLRALLATTGQ